MMTTLCEPSVSDELGEVGPADPGGAAHSQRQLTPRENGALTSVMDEDLPEMGMVIKTTPQKTHP